MNKMHDDFRRMRVDRETFEERCRRFDMDAAEARRWQRRAAWLTLGWVALCMAMSAWLVARSGALAAVAAFFAGRWQ